MSQAPDNQDDEEVRSLLEFAARPHDALFKRIYSQPAIAIAFFNNHLPAEVASAADWSTLTVVSSHFISHELHQTQADLLFRFRVGEQDAYVHLLFEHQSTPDATMPLRLLRYMLQIWDQHGPGPLPVVIPMVLHQGPERWTISQDFRDCVALPEDNALARALVPFVPAFTHGLLDLSQYDPDAAERDPAIRALLKLMKLARQRQAELEVLAWLRDMANDSLLAEHFRLICSYLLSALSELDVNEVAHTLEGRVELQHQAMTIAQKLMAEGRAEGEARGRAEGEARGRAEGEARGRAEGSLRLLQKLMKLPSSSDEELAGLSVAVLEERFRELEQEYASRYRDRG